MHRGFIDIKRDNTIQHATQTHNRRNTWAPITS